MTYLIISLSRHPVMSKRPLDINGNANAEPALSSPSSSKITRYGDNNRTTVKYLEALQKASSKFRLQNASDPEERPFVNQLTSFEKLVARIDWEKTLASATIHEKQPTNNPNPKQTTRSDPHADDETIKKLNDLLRRHFNYAEFRGNQLEVMLCLLKGLDCFVKMSTGSGKSLMFTLPCLTCA